MRLRHFLAAVIFLFPLVASATTPSWSVSDGSYWRHSTLHTHFTSSGEMDSFAESQGEHSCGAAHFTSNYNYIYMGAGSNGVCGSIVFTFYPATSTSAPQATCPTGSVLDPTSNSCLDAAGTKQPYAWLPSNWNPQTNPDICLNGTDYTWSGIAMNEPDHVVVTDLVSTGQPCSSSVSTNSPGSVPSTTPSPPVKSDGNGGAVINNTTFPAMPNGCGEYNGQVVCGGVDPQSPPAPDSGNVGVPATPDLRYYAKPTQSSPVYNQNYYDNNTVNQSTNYGQGGGGTSTSNGSGSSTCTTDSNGTQTCTTQETTQSKQSGFTPPNSGQPAPDSYSKTLSNFYQSVSNSPIAQAANGISASVPSGGTCPTISLDLSAFQLGTVTTDVHCQLWQQITPTLETAMRIVWSLLAVIIFLSA
ncbi:MAG: hypothetical protein P8011_01485 [Acidihalobacter sp.]|uniref:hypothetical protein n=1 Tax=Acidihalobacter sp. TaxID=1872108 RepID=UPI00307DBDBF